VSIPLAEPVVTGRELDYVAKCFADGWLSSVGPIVDEFESRLATVCERRHAVAVSSGTAALHLGLKAVGVRPGDLVLTQSFTFIATANAVALAGAEPLFVDSDAATWNMGVAALEDVLAECRTKAGDLIHRPTGKRVAAVMPVLILGLCADIDALCQLAERAGLPVVVDAAEAALPPPGHPGQVRRPGPYSR
jgi:dTDP-4-amino-4,6-dideoxygalactose transaminase